MSDDELRAAAELVVEHCVAVPNAGRDLTPVEDAAFAVITAWQVGHPPDDGGLPFDAWSFVRDVLQRGTAIERHCESKGLGHEQFSARLDAAAREYADRLKPHLTRSRPCPTPSPASETGLAGGSGAGARGTPNC